MNYSTEQLAQIKDLAANLTPLSDIATLMSLNPYVLRTDVADWSHPASEAYRTGKAETALQLRKNELQLARVGSPLAVQLSNTFLTNMDIDEDL